MMTPERWRRIEEVFEEVLDQPEPARAAWLARTCHDDTELQSLVERMLLADREAHATVDAPAIPGSAIDPYLGATFGPWHIDSKIADGGMGTVYRASRSDGAFTRPVALKLLHVGLLSESMRRRFLREPAMLGRIEHRNIARLLDGGATPDGVPYLVMELVDGMPIDRYCDEHRLDVVARLKLFGTVCTAVDHAHRCLVLHRDLKPNNILVDREGEPRLVDFGVAALLEDPDASGEDVPRTGTSPAAYTPEYASPEQMGNGVVGIASDVWSLGIVLYELLTGERPFRSATIREISDDPDRPLRMLLPSSRFLVGQRKDPSEPRSESPEERARRRASTPARLSRNLRGDLDRIVAMALDPDPGRRYPNCREFAADLERYLQGFPVLAQSRSATVRVAKFVRRHRLATLLACALALSLVVGTIVSTHLARQAKFERDAAVVARHVAETEAEHATIEAKSSTLITESLTEVFLNSRFFDDPELRNRARDRILEQAVTTRARYAHDGHLRANLIDALGNAARRIGALEEARTLIIEALETRTATFGADHIERALSLASLGTLEYEQGNAVAARDAFEAACRIQLEHPSEVHVDLARAKNDLAAACGACGEFERAVGLHREVLALRQAIDPGSSYVAESENNLSAALARIGRVDEAKSHLDAAIEIRRRILGESAYLTLQSIGNRGVLEHKVGNYAQARGDLEVAVKGMRNLRAEGRNGLAILLPRLAQACLALDELVAAEQALDEAVAIARSIYPVGHPRIADVLAQRAALLAKKGDRAAAIAAWEEVLGIRRAALPADHPTIAVTLVELGIVRTEAGTTESIAAAIADLEASLALRSDDSESEGVAHLALGNAYFKAGRFQDAEREMLRARESTPSSERELSAAIRSSLAIVYRATGRETEAAALDADGK